MTTEADAGDEPIDNVDAWLERNADVVDVERERQKQTESWERATAGAGEGDLEERDGVGRWALKLPDSDDYHELLIVRGGAGGDLVGACDCKGNRLHSTPCAHLCAMVQLDVLDDVVPIDEGLAGELAFGVDAEVIEHDAGDDVQEAEVVDVEDSSPSSGDEPG